MGPAKKRKAVPSVIQGESFNHAAELTPEVLGKLTVLSPADTSSLVSEWTGGLGCGMVCTLSNDNAKVVSCSPVLFGNLLQASNSGSKKSFALNAVWAGFPSLSLSLNPIDGSAFSFKESMVSSWLDCGAVEYDLLSNGEALSDDACERGNLRGFCLRVFLVPISAEYVKLTLTLCPLPLVDLAAEHPLYENPKFPQIKLWQGNIPFLPQARSFLDCEWGCSFLPSILPGGPITGNFPTSATLRFAIGYTLRQATKPENKAGHTTLLPRWEALKTQGVEALDRSQPDLLWPDMDSASSLPTGRQKFVFLFLACLLYF